MYYFEAVDEILDKASAIKLPGKRIDVVTAARREFARKGACESKLIDPIEDLLREFLQSWTPEQKREIWRTTETGADNDEDCDGYDQDTIDMQLEGELMYHLIEELAGANQVEDFESDD